MKIDIEPGKPTRWKPEDEINWLVVEPFNANPRGILIHRIKHAKSHISNGKITHDSMDYWCGGCVSGAGCNAVEVPPAERLLCARCEQIAVANGQPTADVLAGRHVHVGVMKPIRVCCQGVN